MDVSPRMMVSVATACIPFLENDDCNRALTFRFPRRHRAGSYSPFAVDKRFGIVRQLLFLDLIANQVGQLHMRDIGDRHNFSAPVSLSIRNAFMQPEPSHAVFLIKFCKSLLHFFRRMVQTEPLRKIADPVADTGIVYCSPADCPRRKAR